MTKKTEWMNELKLENFTPTTPGLFYYAEQFFNQQRCNGYDKKNMTRFAMLYIDYTTFLKSCKN